MSCHWGKQLRFRVECIEGLVIELLFARYLRGVNGWSLRPLFGKGNLHIACLVSGGLFYSVVATRRQPISDRGGGVLMSCMAGTEHVEFSPTGQTLHQARSAMRFGWASRMKGELHPTKNSF